VSWNLVCVTAPIPIGERFPVSISQPKLRRATSNADRKHWENPYTRDIQPRDTRKVDIDFSWIVPNACGTT